MSTLHRVFETMQKGRLMTMDTSTCVERDRCLRILNIEAKRGRELLTLLDKNGAPFYDPEIVRACIETIEYCAARIMDGDEPRGQG